MSVLNNLNKKSILINLGEDGFFAERVQNYTTS